MELEGVIFNGSAISHSSSIDENMDCMDQLIIVAVDTSFIEGMDVAANEEFIDGYEEVEVEVMNEKIVGDHSYARATMNPEIVAAVPPEVMNVSEDENIDEQNNNFNFYAPANPTEFELYKNEIFPLPDSFPYENKSLSLRMWLGVTCLSEVKKFNEGRGKEERDNTDGKKIAEVFGLNYRTFMRHFQHKWLPNAGNGFLTRGLKCNRTKKLVGKSKK